MYRIARMISRSLPVLILAFAIVSTTAQPACAQGSVSTNSIVGAICLVLLIPLLTLFILCLSANRRERERPEDYSATRLAETREKAPKEQRRKQPERKGPEVSKDAKSALTMSIVGFFFPPMLLVGVFMGFGAKKKIAQDRRLTGEGTALAAIIAGFVGMGLWLLTVVMIIVLFFL